MAYIANAGSGEDSSSTITTTLQYDTDDAPAAGGNGGLIDQLVKNVTSEPAAPLDEFSYIYTASSNTIAEDPASLSGNENDGIDWVRTGTAASGNTVTITETIGDTGDTEAIATTLNTALLPTQVVDTLTDTTGPITTSTATTKYLYVVNLSTAPAAGSAAITSNRYSANDLPKWGNVLEVDNPDNSWAQFTYDADEGWVTQEDTPLPSTAATTSANTVPNGTPATDSDSDVVQYYYDPCACRRWRCAQSAGVGGCPRETEETLEGDFVQAMFMQYVADDDGYTSVTTRQITNADATDISWDKAQDVLTFSFRSWGTGSETMLDMPGGWVDVQTEANTDGSETITTDTYRGEGSDLTETASSIATINAFGYTVSSDSIDYTSSADPDINTSTTTDAYGRVLTSTVTDSVSSYSATTTTSYTIPGSGDTSWYGPTEVDGAAGSVTQYTYNSAGQIKSQTANGVETDYTFDAAGELIQTMQDPDSATPSLGDAADLRVTQYLYDWQGDVIATKSGVLLDDGGAPIPRREDTITQRPLTFTQYDDGGQVIAGYTYNGTGIGLSDFAGSDGLGLEGVSVDSGTYLASVDGSALVSYSTAGYDAYGDTINSQIYSVDQTDGTINSIAREHHQHL